MRKFLKIKWGFSLAEMMVVMVVLSIIIAAATPIITKRSVSKYKARPAYPGTILMWYGDINNVPAGYALCDGGNDTPDLRDRFIVMAGGGYSVNDTGGANTVPLNNVNFLPSHNHSGYTNSASMTHSHTMYISGDGGSHSHTGYGSIGGVSAGHQHLQYSEAPATEGWGYYTTETYSMNKTTSFYRYAVTSDVIGGSHSHSFTTDSPTHYHSGSITGSHTHTLSINQTSGDQPHNNLPPYYALAFIMKL